jgi:hypothetical protein
MSPPAATARPDEHSPRALFTAALVLLLAAMGLMGQPLEVVTATFLGTDEDDDLQGAAVAPDGSIHRCHYFLYNRLGHPAHITQANLVLTDTYVPCDSFGQCNPCDIKVKNNRFQQFGHVATRIRNIRPQPE